MNGAPRILTVMGSGETTPTMAKAHRAVLERLGGKAGPAVLLDTPYGFQENAAEITDRALAYFRDTVGAAFGLASFASADVDPLERETALVRIREAGLVFAGPGSPSYALRQWQGSAIPGLLAAKLTTGGAVTMASAAALTLGRFTIPVYEIYKVGEAPHWLPGLDLLSPLGLPVAVVPHYDNAEGGTHDTRFCYLGERRLQTMEEQLPDEVFILGVDGHTALIVDLEEGSAEVMGLGGVTVRKNGRSAVFPAGSVVALADLVAAASGGGPGTPASPGADMRPTESPASLPLAERPTESQPLLQEVAALEAIFNRSLDECDPSAAVRAILTLEETIQAWAADTEQSDALERARAALRSAIVCLGEMAVEGARDPRELLAPFVEALLVERDQARAASDWEAADGIRETLLGAGVELHDSPDGTTWEIKEPAGGTPQSTQSARSG